MAIKKVSTIPKNKTILRGNATTLKRRRIPTWMINATSELNKTKIMLIFVTIC